MLENWTEYPCLYGYRIFQDAQDSRTFGLLARCGDDDKEVVIGVGLSEKRARALQEELSTLDDVMHNLRESPDMAPGDAAPSPTR